MSPTTISKSVSENEKAEIGKDSSLSSSSRMRKKGGEGEGSKMPLSIFYI